MTCSTSIISKIRWDTYSRTFIFKDKTWALIDLTGSVVKFSVKKNPSDVSYVLQVTLTLDPLIGKASISSEMSMDIWVYVYDFEWTKSTGVKETFEIGKLTINNGVS